MVARITGSFKEIELCNKMAELCNKMAMVYDFNGVGQKSTFFMEYLLGMVYIQVRATFTVYVTGVDVNESSFIKWMNWCL